jgi:hypothetical protein
MVAKDFGNRCLLDCSAVYLMMEAARTSETLVNLYQTTRRYNPEDSYLHTHRRQNLKSYKDFTVRDVHCPRWAVLWRIYL